MTPPPHTHVWYSLMASLFVRLQRLEESLKDEPEEQKSEKRAQHAVKETEFLRLKRSKISVEDFDPIKVIGRGAFGEVRYANYNFLKLLFNFNLTCLHVCFNAGFLS